MLDSAKCGFYTKNAESAPFCHSERSEESKKSPFVILSESEESQKNLILSKAKYLKNNNRDSSVATLPQNDNVGLDSAKKAH